MKALKGKTCKASDCEKTFTPWSSLHTACSSKCAITVAKENQKKKFKRETLTLKRDMNANDRSYQLRKAQEAFNAYIRARDKGLPCISCGRIGGRMTAGHFKSVGAYPALRFETLNAHGQCWWNCNSNKSGNIHEYRKHLIDKIGQDKVDWLEGPHDAKNYTLDEIKEITRKFKAMTKTLDD